MTILSEKMVALLICVAGFMLCSTAQSIEGPSQYSTRDIIARIEEMETRDKQHRDEIQNLLKNNAVMSGEIRQLQERDIHQTNRIAVLEKQVHDYVETTSQLKEQYVQQTNRIAVLEKQVRDFVETTSQLKEQDVQQTNRIAVLEKQVRDFVKTTSHIDGFRNDPKTNSAVPSLNEVDKGTSRQSGAHSRIRQVNREMPVAFFATVTNHTLHLGQHQPIVFDHSITNIGQGYHTSTGVFTAPLSGIYVFSTTILGHEESKHLSYAVNGKDMSKLYLHSGTGEYETTSQTAIFNLNQGDDVTFSNLDTDKWVHGYHYCSFSGFLLYANPDSQQIVG